MSLLNVLRKKYSPFIRALSLKTEKVTNSVICPPSDFKLLFAYIAILLTFFVIIQSIEYENEKILEMCLN